MILGVKGALNQHCIAGGGGMHKFALFLQKRFKTFGQDCRKAGHLTDKINGKLEKLWGDLHLLTCQNFFVGTLPLEVIWNTDMLSQDTQCFGENQKKCVIIINASCLL